MYMHVVIILHNYVNIQCKVLLVNGKSFLMAVMTFYEKVFQVLKLCSMRPLLPRFSWHMLLQPSVTVQKKSVREHPMSISCLGCKLEDVFNILK